MEPRGTTRAGKRFQHFLPPCSLHVRTETHTDRGTQRQRDARARAHAEKRGHPTNYESNRHDLEYDLKCKAMPCRIE